MYKNIFKRYLDLLVAVVLLIVLSPVFLLTAAMLKIDSNGPIFFIQKRLGMHGEVFDLYKFRSMVDAPRASDRQVYGDDLELTRYGAVIRRFKIDELPQLINVLKGDMSIVGPRPCLPELQSHFDENGSKRIVVRPGMTGLAQVNGNIFLTWPERWRFDSIYVDNLTFFNDCVILFRTVAVVLFGEKRRIL